MSAMDSDTVRGLPGLEESGDGHCIEQGAHSLAYWFFGQFTDCILGPAGVLAVCCLRVVVIIL